MALSVQEIKKGFLHPEVLVREQALRYFTDSWSTDPTVMPLVVEAVQKLQWHKAILPHLHLSRLRQTPETLSWLVDELEQAEQTPKDPEFHKYLWKVVAAADVGLLRPHEDRLLRIEGDDYHRKILYRIRLDNLGPAECWRELEEFCEAEKNKHYFSGEADIGRADLLVEAIGRDAASADRVMSLLATKVEKIEGNPMTWMEGLAIGIAGELRIKPAIPVLIGKLRADLGDWINQECTNALSKIGGDEVAVAIEKEFESTWEFRLYAADVLTSNRGATAAERALRLFELEMPRRNEENGLIASNLLLTGLANFSPDAVESARRFVPRRWEGAEEVRERLVGTAMLLGISFPELEEWKKQSRQYRRDVERRVEEMARWKPPLPRYEVAPAKPARERKPPEPIEVAQAVRVRQSVGRNDPCPCGSGKKYKKCCIGKK
jgi:hypothetical protein